MVLENWPTLELHLEPPVSFVMSQSEDGVKQKLMQWKEILKSIVFTDLNG